MVGGWWLVDVQRVYFPPNGYYSSNIEGIMREWEREREGKEKLVKKIGYYSGW